MFLHNRLPLYVALFYPAFIYHAFMTIRTLPCLNGVPVTSAPRLRWRVWSSISISGDPGVGRDRLLMLFPRTYGVGQLPWRR